MMDEYIPSPRPTPNKPRRMRDVSALYPVDEKKLLLEAILKRQHDGCGGAGEMGVGVGVGAGVGRGRDPSPRPRARAAWPEDRTCPVCRWTSTSPLTSASEYDGDESDDTSAGDEPPPDETSSVSDEDSAEEDGNRESAEPSVGNATDEPTAGDSEISANAQELKIDDAAQRGDQKVEVRDINDNVAPSLTLPQLAELADCHPERESYPSPGKLLYGRHCLWYQSAGFVRPQGGK